MYLTVEEQSGKIDRSQPQWMHPTTGNTTPTTGQGGGTDVYCRMPCVLQCGQGTKQGGTAEQPKNTKPATLTPGGIRRYTQRQDLYADHDRTQQRRP